jgi:hypothetical protein
LTREAFGGLGLSRGTKERFQGIASRADGSGEIGPGCADFDVRFVDFPRVIGGFEVRSRALFQFGSVVLNPAGDSGMVHLQSPFGHQFLQIAIAERVAKVPAHTQENDLGFPRDAM